MQPLLRIVISTYDKCVYAVFRQPAQKMIQQLNCLLAGDRPVINISREKKGIDALVLDHSKNLLQYIPLVINHVKIVYGSAQVQIP